jgi:DNA-binding transcriptional LysR family regulator
MVTLRQIAHAQAVAKWRNFRVAAGALHLSQPALTRSIRTLEAALGVPLFDRLSSGVEPTPFGEVFLRRAELVLRERDDLLREVQLLQGLGRGDLRISAGPYPTDLLVPETLAALVSANPGLTCRLKLGNWRDVAADVISREADLGIADLGALAGDERISVERIGQHRFHLFCRAGHPLLQRPTLGLRDVVSVPWVGTRLPGRLARAMDLPGARAGTIDPATGDLVLAFQVEIIDAARRIVAASDAVSGAMLVQIERELREGALAILGYEADWMRFDYGFIVLRDRTLSPAARAFMEEFRRRDADLAAREAVLEKSVLRGRAAAGRRRT